MREATGPVIPGAGRDSNRGWTEATRPTPFPVIVYAELRRLTDTVAGRLLLLAAPPMILLMNVMALSLSQDGTVSGQIAAIVVPIELGQVFAHGALIRSITAEWLHGGVRGTLLYQPSRLRYVLSQVSVAGVLWLGCAALQVVFALLLGPMSAAHNGVPYLLGDRWGWVVAVCLLGSFLGMLATLTVSLLLLNPAAAVASYFVVVPVATILASIIPRLAWVNPFTPLTDLAGMNESSPAEGAVSLAVWVALLAAAAYRIHRMDIE